MFERRRSAFWSLYPIGKMYMNKAVDGRDCDHDWLPSQLTIVMTCRLLFQAAVELHMYNTYHTPYHSNIICFLHISFYVTTYT